MRIAITGAGIVSALGIGIDATTEALRSKRSGISSVRWLDTACKDFPVGEVDLGEAQMRSMLGIPPSLAVNRTALLGIIALKEALERSGAPGVDAIISGTTVGGMEKSEALYSDFMSSSPVHTDYIRTHDCGSSTCMISDYFGGGHIATTLSTACSSAANAVIFGANLIRSGKARRVAVGGSECLSDYHLRGFASLMILDRKICRPFDRDREGLNLGEGAAFLILDADATDAPYYLTGWGNACDAYHQTASSPEGEGAFLAMQKAIAMSGLNLSDIDYINAHGTGTPNNDASESAALRRIFGSRIPPVSSTKSYTGHATSAAGSLEAVISLIAMKEGFIPASLGFENPDPDCIVPSGGENAVLRNVLSNSFGFGGNDTSLIFSR